jgi:nucleoside-diphosphate-sugar epimerase
MAAVPSPRSDNGRGRIVITGAAGLVGQNLMPRIKALGFSDIVAIDKHSTNARILSELHPDVRVVMADLARDNGWQEISVARPASSSATHRSAASTSAPTPPTTSPPPSV